MKHIIRKTHLFTGILLLAGQFATAQEDPEPAPKMKNYLDITYGQRMFFNFQAMWTQNNDQDSFDFNNFQNLGTCGIRWDHLLNPSFSMGLDFYYSQRKSSGTMTEFATGTKSEAVFIVNRFNAQVRLAYHLPLTNPNLDVYFGGGAGINSEVRKLTLNGNNAPSREHPFTLFIPISLRTFAGLRYSFTKHFGTNAEIGLGGPLFSCGFHWRF